MRVQVRTSRRYPFGLTQLNVKTLFADSFGVNHEVGLDGVYEKLGLAMEGAHHRCDHNAWNIADILCRLLGATRKLSHGTNGTCCLCATKIDDAA